jgi:microcin C transport system substrate-binding protein
VRFGPRLVCTVILSFAVADGHAGTIRPGAGAAGSPDSISSAPSAAWSHAFAVFGEPKYPAGFAHYDYANPDAPKGGTLNLGNPDRRSSFSRLNPYLLKGDGAYGAEFFSFEKLCDPSQDEAGVMYGLLAEAIQVAPDLSWVAFRLNPRAHFNNGDPVTAADVKYSFDTITGEKADPGFGSQFKAIRSAVVMDALTVRFDLAAPSRETIYVLGTTLPVFSPKWGLGADGRPKDFDEVIDDVPIASGPYIVARTYNGRRLDLVRDKNYWAQNEGVRRGFFNFDKIVYRYYADNAVQFEAFKAGNIDLVWEPDMKRWVRQYQGARFGPGRIVKHAFPNGQGNYVRALRMNLRRPQFHDVRVREALQLSFDFEWLNAQSFNLYARIDSVFSNSPFKATGLPTPGELVLLEPFRDRLPPTVFGPPFENPRTDTAPDALRNNLKRARDLLAEAGWQVGADRQLRNADGEPLAFEILNGDADILGLLEPWLVNLDKLGIRANIRQVDFALYSKRLTSFDYDVAQLNGATFKMPSASLLKAIWGSDNATKPGSYNFAGVRDPAVDACIAAMASATTRQQLLDAAHALDRVVLHQHYYIPWLRRPTYNAAWWDRFGRPERTPRYFTLTSNEFDVYPWPIMTWWARPPSAQQVAR